MHRFLGGKYTTFLGLTDIRVLKEPLGPSFWFELKVPFAGEVICDYNCSHNKEYRIERYLRSDHREGYHISYCFRISMFGKSLGIEIKAPLVAETNCMSEFPTSSTNSYKLTKQR